MEISCNNGKVKRVMESKRDNVELLNVFYE